ALVPTGEGAFLAWGVPAAQGGGVRSLALGPLGQVLEAERSVVASGSADEGVTPEVEIEAAAVGRQVGLAYVTDRGAIPHALALYSADGGRRFSQPDRKSTRLNS